MRHMEKYSFSKLSSFHQCPLQYWYTYISREQGENNAFAQYGSFVHSLLERWGKDELAEYELLGEYENKFFDRVTQEFPPNKYTDLSKKYYDDGVQFLSNFEGVDAKEILGVEEHFEEPIAAADGRDSFIIQGFIDVRRAIGRKDAERLERAMPKILEGYCKKSDKPREEAEKDAKTFLKVIEDASEYSFG